MRRFEAFCQILEADNEENIVELTTNQQMAKDYLQSKSPEFVSPTEVGREVGLKLGKKDLRTL